MSLRQYRFTYPKQLDFHEVFEILHLTVYVDDILYVRGLVIMMLFIMQHINKQESVYFDVNMY